MKEDHLKVSFMYSSRILVPPALIGKFHDVLRNCEVVTEEYDPREGHHNQHYVEADPPILTMVEEPVIFGQEEWKREEDRLRDQEGDEEEHDPSA